VARCRRVLKREKRLGWRKLCSSFNSKTPTADIWRFIRVYKKKSLAGGCLKADDGSLSGMRNSIVDKLCPPSCLFLQAQSLREMEVSDQQSVEVFSWMDKPFKIGELEAAIDFSCRNSAPGLDRIDYTIIRSFPLTIRLVLLRIFNEIFEQGLFPHDWRTSLIVFVPKPSNEGLRPITLLSCLLKIFEKMVYRRMQWVAEPQFMLPEFQAGFRSFRSCADNLTILTNHIHLAFMNRSPLLAVFLDIAGAFDNVIPNILVQDLRLLGFPA